MRGRLGVREPDAHEKDLVAATADAVADAYLKALDLDALGEPVLALMLHVYWDGSDPSQLAPPVMLIPQRQLTWCVENDALGILWCPYEPEHLGIEIDALSVSEDASLRRVGESFLAFANGPEARDPVDGYFEALTSRLHRALGVLVLVEGIRTMLNDQIRSQLSADELETWRASGWFDMASREDHARYEVLVKTEVAKETFAAVYREDGDRLMATGRFHPNGWGRPVTEALIVVSEDPAVYAGLLPSLATMARVQDLFDVWHDAHVGQDVWLCALPHRHSRWAGLPPITFLDSDSRVVESLQPKEETAGFNVSVTLSGEALTPAVLEEIREAQLRDDRQVIARARVRALWPQDWPEDPHLSGHSGEDDRASGLTMAASEIGITSRDHDDMGIDDPSVAARDLVETRLRARSSAREAARAVVAATVQPFEFLLDDVAQTAAMLQVEGLWAAVWVDPRARLEIEIVGSGTPTQRLALRTFDPAVDVLVSAMDAPDREDFA